MMLLTAENAETYLRERGHLRPDDRVRIERLTGGVSNEVMYVSIENRAAESFVLKQAREQLRVPDAWFSRLDRIWREVEVLKICQEILERAAQEIGARPLGARTPRILFEDREHYAFGMEAAPRSHVVWKQPLLAGDFDERDSPGRPDRVTPGKPEQVARQCGGLLGRIHAGSWEQADVAARLEDRQIFDELRIDPYYRKIAAVHPELRPAIERLIESVWSHRRALVHADFSPKNLLVYPGGLMMVDFETGHYGDPAFDLGFFLSHLILKSFYHARQPHNSRARQQRCFDLTEEFWRTYHQTLAKTISGDEYQALVARGILNFAGCLLARVDGKSKVDYLTDDQARQAVRNTAREVLNQSPESWQQVIEICRSETNRFRDA